MINKKNLLGKTPQELGVKDAIHVAIVAVRAAHSISRGSRCDLNKYREAISSEKGCGIADPFTKNDIFKTGDVFWLLLDQDEVPNVQHQWDHPSIDFTPPVREPVMDEAIQRAANSLGLTYPQLMNVCEALVYKKPVVYNGTLTPDKLNTAIDEIETSDLWWAWSEETGYIFENQGTGCCPEYNYPSIHFTETEG